MAESIEILQLGHPLLTQWAEPVQFPLTDETDQLIDSLIQVMQQRQGVGIAAPQIGRSQQVIVVASRPNLRYPNAPTMEPVVMLNPQIQTFSDDQEFGWEGCLSVPSIRGQVSRAIALEVAYLDLAGKPQVRQYEGFVARIIQHEIDHLQGKLFLDRVPSTNHLMSEQEFFRQVL